MSKPVDLEVAVRDIDDAACRYMRGQDRLLPDVHLLSPRKTPSQVDRDLGP